MYRTHVYLAIVCLVFPFIIVMFLSFEMPATALSGFITFFSITFGFQMTSLSILFGSQYIKRINEIRDDKLRTRNQLQVLTGYFKRSTYVSLVAILMLLFSSAVGLDGSDESKMLLCKTDILGAEFQVCWQTVFSALTMSAIAINILFIVILLKLLFRAFLEEGNVK